MDDLLGKNPCQLCVHRQSAPTRSMPSPPFALPANPPPESRQPSGAGAQAAVESWAPKNALAQLAEHPAQAAASQRVIGIAATWDFTGFMARFQAIITCAWAWAWSQLPPVLPSLISQSPLVPALMPRMRGLYKSAPQSSLPAHNLSAPAAPGPLGVPRVRHQLSQGSIPANFLCPA
jgi:hypothetical protein